MQQITPTELATWLADTQRPRPVLLDVREPWEFEGGHIEGAMLMPMHTVPARLNDLSEDTPLVCICHHGGRSMQVAMFLEARGFQSVLNLNGGMDQWSCTIDPAIRRY